MEPYTRSYLHPNMVSGPDLDTKSMWNHGLLGYFERFWGHDFTCFWVQARPFEDHLVLQGYVSASKEDANMSVSGSPQLQRYGTATALSISHRFPKYPSVITSKVSPSTRLFRDAWGKKHVLFGLRGNILGSQKPEKAKNVSH